MGDFRTQCETCQGWILTPHPKDKLEHAVIEAAKAFIAKSEDSILVPWHDLRRAVEALEEVESE